MKKLILFLFCFSCLIFANEDNYVCKNAIGDMSEVLILSKELDYNLEIITTSNLDLNNINDREKLKNLVHKLDNCNNDMGIVLNHIKDNHESNLSTKQLQLLNTMYNVHTNIKENNLKLNNILNKEVNNEK